MIEDLFYKLRNAKLELLTNDETLSLISDAKSNNGKSKDAIEKLIFSNSGLILKTISQYYYQLTPTFDMDDILSVAIYSFIKAINHFDESKGYRFSTYAVNSMKFQIWRSLETIALTLRLPVNKQRERYYLFRILSKYQQIDTDQDKIDYLVEMSDFTKKKVRTLLSLPTNVKSLNEPITEESDSQLGDFVSNDKNEIEELEKRLDREKIINYIKENLNEKEAQVLLMYYGFVKNSGKKYTFSKLSKELGVSREQVRLYRNNALKKLRNNGISNLIP